MTANAAPPVPAGPPPLALCVDGNPRLLEIVAKILAALGVDCLTAADAGDALAQARARYPQLLILDWQLPQTNGWELLDDLRAALAPRAPRVIILSAREDGFEPMLAENVARADAYLEKPIDIDKFSREICRLLELPLPGSAPHA